MTWSPELIDILLDKLLNLDLKKEKYLSECPYKYCISSFYGPPPPSHSGSRALRPRVTPCLYVQITF